MAKDPGPNLAARVPREPRHCFWEITDACNLRCVHCEADAGRASEDELSTAEALALAEDLARAGCRNVNLTGGEPLVRPDWADLARRLADRGVSVTVITNGLLVDDSVVAELVASGVSGVSVSLDGERAVHDAIRLPVEATDDSRHDAALGAIERVVASPLKCAVITQVHRRNLSDLGTMHERLAGLGVDAWQVQLCMPLGRLLRYRSEYLLEPAQLPELEEQLAGFIDDGRVPVVVADNIGYYSPREPKLRGSHRGRSSFWAGCLAGCRVVALCANGDVKGCPSHPRPFVVGNVRETPFAELWADGSLFSYNTAWDETLLEGSCARCAYRGVCRAGCTTMAYSVTGTIYDNPFCIQRSHEGGEA
ncbi:MAG: radical SAM protein [bacterium]